MRSLGARAVLAALVIIVPLVGAFGSANADDMTPLYVFQTGSPGDPRWVVFELNVTQEGVLSQVYYESSAMRCPMLWATEFLTGPASSAHAYDGLTFSYHHGRNGADAYANTPVFGEHDTTMQNDGQDLCNAPNYTVNYGELPLGTVWVVQYVTGVPFVATSTFRVSGAGASIVGVSTGSSAFYVNESDMFSGASVDVFAPPTCGAIEVPCSQGHMNAGDSYGASFVQGRQFPVKFRHHPFWQFEDDSLVSVSNASVQAPDGSMRYGTSPVAPGTPVQVLGGDMQQFDTGASSGQYWFRVVAGAGVSALNAAGWHVSGADITFPGET